MGLYVAAVLIIVGIVAVISGVDGTGLTLFQSAFGTPGTKAVTTTPAAPTHNAQGVPFTQVVAQ